MNFWLDKKINIHSSSDDSFSSEESNTVFLAFVYGGWSKWLWAGATILGTSFVGGYTLVAGAGGYTLVAGAGVEVSSSSSSSNILFWVFLATIGSSGFFLKDLDLSLPRTVAREPDLTST